MDNATYPLTFVNPEMPYTLWRKTFI